MRRQEFACARLSNPYMTRSQPRLFHNVHHRDLATEAAYGCLKPPPAGRLRRAHLHLPYSMALACLHDTRPREFLGSRIGGVYLDLIVEFFLRFSFGLIRGHRPFENRSAISVDSYQAGLSVQAEAIG